MNGLLDGATPCEVKTYKGKKYITLDGRNILAGGACNGHCSEHPKCKKPMLYKIVQQSLRGECPYCWYGFSTPVEYLHKEREQVTLDRWF